MYGKKLQIVHVHMVIYHVNLWKGSSMQPGFSAPAAWNSLAKHLHDSSISLLSLKSMLMTYKFVSLLVLQLLSFLAFRGAIQVFRYYYY